MSQPKDRLDPITLAVIKGGLQQIVDEMDAIIVRAAFSTVISEQKDRASGIFDPRTGEMVAQGSYTLPIFVTAMQFSVQSVMEDANRRGGLQQGDIYIMNNPYLGGTHLPDVKLVAPVFDGDELIAIVAACGHWSDIGGSTPGGFAPSATEVLQEGIVINPVPLFRKGVLDENLLGLIIDNVRIPDERRGDIEATISALNIGCKRFIELTHRYSIQTMLHSFNELNNRSEMHMRSLIKGIPNATYEFEDALDNDGNSDSPLVIRLKLTVSDEKIHFDFSNSSAPTIGPLNVPARTCVAACQIAMKHIFPEIPINGGCFRPFDYTVPTDTFLGAIHPRPISGYPETVGRIISVVFGALSKALPERVQADNFGTTGIITFSGNHPITKNYYVALFPAAGGYGGGSKGGGLVNGPTPLGAANYPSVESTEHQLPIQITKLAIRNGSGGAGEHPGGCGTDYEYKILDGKVNAVVLGDRCKFAPFGLHGGKSGLSGDVIFYTQDGTFKLPMVSKGKQPMVAGDKLHYMSPGGGGYGNPLKRAQDKVLLDVKYGYITNEQAQSEYGVVIIQSKQRLEVDETKTNLLRNKT